MRTGYSKGYGDLPSPFFHYENSKVVVIPVPYDETSTWGKGADKGPDALLDASANMELYDIETDSEPYKNGIFTEKPINEKASPDKMVEAVEKKVLEHINNNKFIVLLGGEHSVTVGSVYAHAKKFKNLSVLQLDAHTDLRHEFHGSRFNHACAMARSQEVASVIQVGIRSMDSSEKIHIDKNKIFFAENIVNDRNWIDKVIGKLSENVYITIDLDAFDPSILPSTGTPEPGGLQWYETLTLLKETCKRKNVVGFDVVELCPDKINKHSDFLAAKLVYKILSYRFGGIKNG